MRRDRARQKKKEHEQEQKPSFNFIKKKKKLVVKFGHIVRIQPDQSPFTCGFQQSSHRDGWTDNMNISAVYRIEYRTRHFCNDGSCDVSRC